MYPGSFDPITNGHLDLIKRASKIFDKVTVAILINSSKKSMFSCEERVELIKKCVADIDNVEVKTFSGLLVDFMKQENAKIIIKGLRAVSDYEYELQMGLMNKRLNSNIETMFMMASSEYSYLSSSIIKEVARYDGNIEGLIPSCILDIVKARIKSV